MVAISRRTMSRFAMVHTDKIRFQGKGCVRHPHDEVKLHMCEKMNAVLFAAVRRNMKRGKWTISERVIEYGLSMCGRTLESL